MPKSKPKGKSTNNISSIILVIVGCLVIAGASANLAGASSGIAKTISTIAIVLGAIVLVVGIGVEFFKKSVAKLNK